MAYLDFVHDTSRAVDPLRSNFLEKIEGHLTVFDVQY